MAWIKLTGRLHHDIQIINSDHIRAIVYNEDTDSTVISLGDNYRVSVEEHYEDIAELSGKDIKWIKS